jgi:hypothetical protein
MGFDINRKKKTLTQYNTRSLYCTVYRYVFKPNIKNSTYQIKQQLLFIEQHFIVNCTHYTVYLYNIYIVKHYCCSDAPSKMYLRNCVYRRELKYNNIVMS